jgi:tight adherence protein B
MNPATFPLLMIGFFLLMMSCGAMLLLRMNAKPGTPARVLTVLSPYRAATTVKRDFFAALVDRVSISGIGKWLIRLFGIELRHAPEYPLHWGIVLAGTLAAAPVATWLIALVFADLHQSAPVPVIWVLLSRVVFGVFARRRRELLFNQFPDALSMIVRGVRVGQTVTQALRTVARDAQKPTSVAFVRLADRLAIGVPLAEALPELATDSGLTEYRFFATTLMLQSQTGGALTEALETLSDMMRGRINLRRRAYAMAGEARASAVLLATMPVVTFAGVLVAAPEYGRVLLDDPLGRKLLGIGIGLILTGGVVMHTMIKSLLR